MVQTLVDEGVTIDSTDIIYYLQANCKPNSLRPDTETELQGLYDWMASNAFTLADIAWIPQLVILHRAGYSYL